MESYLQHLEVIRTQEQALPWHRRTTTFGDAEGMAQVLVPSQTNGHDCGVYVCCMADLLEREQDIRQIRPPLIRLARQQLYQSMIHSAAHPLIAEDAGEERRTTEEVADQTTLVPPSQTVATPPILLLGMVYTKAALMNSKRQLTRDGIRCRALEYTEHVKVHTIDVTHNADQAEEGRHISHDFAKPGVLGEMDARWKGKVFKHITHRALGMPNDGMRRCTQSRCRY